MADKNVTVNYLEQDFIVPVWATHIAADYDGEVYAYRVGTKRLYIGKVPVVFFPILHL